jgi:8-oxo-dGTP diphosphatase
MSTATVMAYKNGKLLLLKRGEGAPWNPGKWDFPGGGIDEGETPKEAAAREALEEVSMEVRTLRELTVLDIEGELVHFFVTDFYFGNGPNGTLAIGPEHDEFKWVTLSEAMRMDVVPGIRRAIFYLQSISRP